MKKTIAALVIALPLIAAGNVKAQETYDVNETITKAREASDNLHAKKTDMQKSWNDAKDNAKNLKAKGSDSDSNIKNDMKQKWKDQKAEYKKQSDDQKAEYKAKKDQAKSDLKAIKDTWK